jgi:hypothetical protein
MMKTSNCFTNALTNRNYTACLYDVNQHLAKQLLDLTDCVEQRAESACKVSVIILIPQSAKQTTSARSYEQ